MRVTQVAGREHCREEQSKESESEADFCEVLQRHREGGVKIEEAAPVSIGAHGCEAQVG